MNTKKYDYFYGSFYRKSEYQMQDKVDVPKQTDNIKVMTVCQVCLSNSPLGTFISFMLVHIYRQVQPACLSTHGANI